MVLVCLGLGSCPRCRTWKAKTRDFGGKLGQLGTLPLAPCLSLSAASSHTQDSEHARHLCAAFQMSSTHDGAGELGKTEWSVFQNRGTPQVVRTGVWLPVFIEGDTTLQHPNYFLLDIYENRRWGPLQAP